MTDSSTAYKSPSFIRVYRLPEQLTNGYCFGNGMPITILNVDWFDAPADMTREDLEPYIKKKAYYLPVHRYLVLGEQPHQVFMIERNP